MISFSRVRHTKNIFIMSISKYTLCRCLFWSVIKTLVIIIFFFFNKIFLIQKLNSGQLSSFITYYYYQLMIYITHKYILLETRLKPFYYHIIIIYRNCYMINKYRNRSRKLLNVNYIAHICMYRRVQSK